MRSFERARRIRRIVLRIEADRHDLEAVTAEFLRGDALAAADAAQTVRVIAATGLHFVDLDLTRFSIPNK